MTDLNAAKPKELRLAEAYADLNRMFDEFNKEFFGGRLEKFEVVPGEATEFTPEGECDHKARVITIYDPTDIRRNLLHEMCHVESPPQQARTWRDQQSRGHDSGWQEAMHRLAEQGEEWAREQAENFPTWQAMVSMIHDSLAYMARLMVNGERQVNYEEHVLRWAARIIRQEPKLAEETMPWLRNSWKTQLIVQRQYAEDGEVSPELRAAIESFLSEENS